NSIAAFHPSQLETKQQFSTQSSHHSAFPQAQLQQGRLFYSGTGIASPSPSPIISSRPQAPISYYQTSYQQQGSLQLGPLIHPQQYQDRYYQRVPYNLPSL
ncbi:hypothetical protein BX616_009355, partial [Lobosporangium transversale]